MPNLVMEAAHLVLVGDVIRMKMMNIGGGTASPSPPLCCIRKDARKVVDGKMSKASNMGNNQQMASFNELIT